MYLILSFVALLGMALFLIGCVAKRGIEETKAPRPYIIQQSISGRWIWQIVSRNNELLAQSEQDFSDASGALENFITTRDVMEQHADPQVIHGTSL